MARFVLGCPRSLHALVCVIVCMAPYAASAQIPDKFTNLKVLSKDISKRELVSVMRGFAGGLGVRCNHCHVGEDAATLKNFDFASDSKAAKQTARVMMAMVREINTTVKTKSGVKDPVGVQCVTCHHGITRPEQIEDVLKSVIVKDGVAASVKKYRELREKNYGSATYDFKPGPLAMVAEWLTGRKDYDGAIAIMQLALELNPGEAYGYNLLGRIQQTKGDKAGAIASYKRAIELDSTDVWSKELLKKIE